MLGTLAPVARRYTESWPRWWTVSNSIIHSASARRNGAVAPPGPTGMVIVLWNVSSDMAFRRLVASLCACSNVETSAFQSFGAGGGLCGSSFGTVRMGSVTNCETTSVHAVSVAVFERSAGLYWFLFAGYALSTRSVIAYSR